MRKIGQPARTRSYDGLDRLIQEATPQGTVSYGYDAASRRSSMTVAGQPAVSYSYDTGDRLTQIIQGATSVGFGYDADARRTSLTLPNGIIVDSAYDAASRLTGLTYKLGGTTLGSLTYAYDASGNRTLVGGTWARTGLPTAVASSNFDANNRQLGFGAATMSYDLNGNLATLTDASGTTTYTWNAREQLAGLGGPGLTASFSYDGIGRRWTKVINGARTDFLYDALNPVQEGILPGTVAANLLTGLGIDEFFSRADVAGPRHVLTDALGSTLVLTDATGATQTEYTYEPFGAASVSGVPSANPYQYTGRESDGTGLFYYRARYYYPGLFRFISEDPVGFAGGDVNLYAYVWGMPLRFRDPSGLGADESGLPPPGPSMGRKDPPMYTCGSGPQLTMFDHILPNCIPSGGAGARRGSGSVTPSPVPPSKPPRRPPQLEIPLPPPYPQNPNVPPGPNWEKKGPNWTNPRTRESLHPDNHPPYGPHHDFIAPDRREYRYFPDGTIELK